MDGPPERFGLYVARETSKEQSRLHLKLTNLTTGNVKTKHQNPPGIKGGRARP